MTKLKPTRFWWDLHKTNLIGGLIAMSVAFGMLIIAAVLLAPSGPSSLMTGEVVGFGMRADDNGSYRVMLVRTDGATYTIRAPMFLDCNTGDAVRLVQTRHWWGRSAAIPISDARPCT